MNPERRASFAQMAKRVIPDQHLNNVLLNLAEVGYEMIDFQDPNMNLDKFALESRGRVGVIVANHRSHADGGVVVEAVRRVNRRDNPANTFLLPIAASIGTGDQTDTIQTFFNAQEAWFKARYIDPIHIVRPKDINNYDMKINRADLRKFASGIRPNGKFFIFPEAHVQGGRINPLTGQRTETIEVDNASLQTVMERSVKKDLEVVFINIGIEGTEKIFDNTEGAQEIPLGVWLNLLPTIAGMGLSMATVKVGQSYTSTDILNSGVSLTESDAINSFVMQRFKGLISDRAMGFYGNAT